MKYVNISEQSKNGKRRKRIIIGTVTAVVVLFLAISVYGFFFGDGGEEGAAVSDAVAENSRLKLELQEKEEEIAALEAELEQLRSNVTPEPTFSPEPTSSPRTSAANEDEDDERPTSSPRRDAEDDEDESPTSSPRRSSSRD